MANIRYGLQGELATVVFGGVFWQADWQGHSLQEGRQTCHGS